METILQLALQFALVFPAIVFHEIAHGYVAYLLGDDTAKRAGRLSINPLRHVDPVGTVILPIAMLILSGGSYFFGWAKPVPINPHGFKRLRRGARPVPGPYSTEMPGSYPQGSGGPYSQPRDPFTTQGPYATPGTSAEPPQYAPWDSRPNPVFGAPQQQRPSLLPTGDARWAQRLGMALTGAAGPATNVTLAILAGLGVRFLAPLAGSSSGFALLWEILLLFTQANLVLAFFNLIPIPPLDGSRVLQFFLPDSARDFYHQLERYGFVILIGATWVFPRLLSTYLGFTVMPVLRLLTGL